MSEHFNKLWDADDEKEVAALILDGRPPREIGAAYGISKNAVIGRIHRSPTLRAALEARGPIIRIIGRPAVAPLPVPVKPKPAKAAVAAATIAAWPSPKNRPGNKVAPSMPAPPPPLPDMRRVPLLDLRNNWCKWAIEEDHTVIGHFIFCGRDTGGPSYCAEHDRIKREGGK